MYRKVILSCVFGISMVAIVGTEAIARCCVLRSSSGTCLYYSGSVECQLNADQVGSPKNKPELSCSVTPSGDGLILCGNPGSKQKLASGAQVVSVPASSSPPTFSDSEPILKDDIKNGIAIKTVTAKSPDLAQLSSFCPNPGWVVLDYVPCQANIEAKQSDQVGTIDTAAFSCILPECNTLGYELTADGPQFERRPYQCTEQ